MRNSHTIHSHYSSGSAAALPCRHSLHIPGNSTYAGYGREVPRNHSPFLKDTIKTHTRDTRYIHQTHLLPFQGISGPDIFHLILLPDTFLLSVSPANAKPIGVYAATCRVSLHMSVLYAFLSDIKGTNPSLSQHTNLHQSHLLHPRRIRDLTDIRKGEKLGKTLLIPADNAGIMPVM